jgi:hypothetical protein
MKPRVADEGIFGLFDLAHDQSEAILDQKVFHVVSVGIPLGPCKIKNVVSHRLAKILSSCTL